MHGAGAKPHRACKPLCRYSFACTCVFDTISAQQFAHLEHAPQRRPCAEGLRVQPVKQIVADHNEPTRGQNGPRRQPDEGCQSDHADPDGPRCSEIDGAEFNPPNGTYHKRVEQDQPCSAGQQKECERAALAELFSMQICGDAREENESGCANMRNKRVRNSAG